MPINFKHQEIVRGHEEPVTKIKQDICCALCELVLLKSVQIKEIPEENNYKFTCPNCGGKSFIHRFSYKAFFEPVNCLIDNIEREGDVWVVSLRKK